MDRLEDLDERASRRRLGNVGGSSGGLSHFLLGSALTVLGGYLLLQQVVVVSHRWRFFGFDGFGISLIPLLLGVGMLFFNAKNPLGWLLAAGGAVVIAGGILTSLDIFFRPASLFNTLIMLFCLVGGLGLVGRSMRSL
jgi:predicted membrane channel-forming protein YqfA (hemolysin III family)